jgi:hypothetical protein
MDIEALAREAVDCGFKIHSELGPGLLESVYEQQPPRQSPLAGDVSTRICLRAKGALSIKVQPGSNRGALSLRLCVFAGNKQRIHPH